MQSARGANNGSNLTPSGFYTTMYIVAGGMIFTVFSCGVCTLTTISRIIYSMAEVRSRSFFVRLNLLLLEKLMSSHRYWLLQIQHVAVS